MNLFPLSLQSKDHGQLLALIDLLRSQGIRRLMAFFVLGSLAVGINVPYTDPELIVAFTNSEPGAAASLYVVATNRLGITVLPDIVNALVLSAAFSAGNSYVYCASRSLFSLALKDKASKIFTRCTRNGVRWSSGDIAVIRQPGESDCMGRNPLSSLTENRSRRLSWSNSRLCHSRLSASRKLAMLKAYQETLCSTKAVFSLTSYDTRFLGVSSWLLLKAIQYFYQDSEVFQSFFSRIPWSAFLLFCSFSGSFTKRRNERAQMRLTC